MRIMHTQVQGEMAVLGVGWCDFTVFSNDTTELWLITTTGWIFYSILHSACGTRIVISKDTN